MAIGRRTLWTGAALVLTCNSAAAEEIMLRADVSAATVYATQSLLTREVALDLPAGAHVVHLAVPDAQAIDLPQFLPIEGVRIGPVERRFGVPITDGALDTPAQAAARAAVETARDGVLAVQDQIARAEIAVQAASLQLAQLEAIAAVGTQPDGLPRDLAGQLAALSAEWTRAATALQDAQQDARALEEARIDAETTLARALEALRALAPYAGRVDVLSVPVESAAAITAPLTFTHVGRDAFWQPRYEVALDSESGRIDLRRSIALEVLSGEVWRDVALRVSTENPSRALAPILPNPTPARVFDPDTIRPSTRLGMADVAAEAPMVMPEPVLAMEAAAVMEQTGLAITYAYATPVDVGPEGLVTLPFDTLDLRAETGILAAPRANSTAFLMANLQNDSGEPILPGEARLIRDGALIGETFLPMIPDGAEERLAFGPLDQIRLSWQDLSRDDGDRGIFTSSSTQVRALRFTVENTGSAPVALTVIYALPFAEQEEVEVSLDFSVPPTDTAWEDLRGVHAWDLTLAANGSRTVDIGVEIVWPEGMALSWSP